MVKIINKTNSAGMMDIYSYLEKNGILQKSPKEIQREFSQIDQALPEFEYYSSFYAQNQDLVLECLNYSISTGFFPALLNALESSENILEPMCMTGILGCYIASHKKNYLGIDMHPAAISNAKKHANKNGVAAECFQESNFLEYQSHHDIIIGRNFLGSFELDTNIFHKCSEVAPVIVALQSYHPSDHPKLAIQRTEKEFRNNGYRHIDLIYGPETLMLTAFEFPFVLGFYAEK
jgi:hypothetical protein